MRENKHRRRTRRAAVCLLLCLLLTLPYACSAAEFGRYLALGFDDFRDSDFSLVLPLLQEYGGTATFNRIRRENILYTSEVSWIQVLADAGNEIGDHTWLHVNYIFSDPLFNGQDPAAPEGGQEPYPGNDMFRADTGEGKNAFGFDLTETAAVSMAPWNGDQALPSVDTPWGELTDEECQRLRDCLSVYRSGELLELLDTVSNRYLGTEGSSRGSWDEEARCYTGGIFTGCRTSANHEIWERMLEVTRLSYQDDCAYYDFDLPPFLTWSWPGPIRDIFVFTDPEGRVWYDREHTLPYNYLARFPSSLYRDENGKPLSRSWTEALRAAGYRMTHDTLYPGRADGQDLPLMSRQLIRNARLSRRDALAFSTNRTVDYSRIATDYPEEFFDDAGGKSRAAQMYDAGGEFYRFVEETRRDTANGLVHGEVIDSLETDSEENFLRGALAYCNAAGIRIVSKREAYEACFGEIAEEGNLIGNPELVNTAKAFMPDAETVPDCPDGYAGACRSIEDTETPTLGVTGEARYLHYGIPLGELCYSAKSRGSGTIRIYVLRNGDSAELNPEETEMIAGARLSDTGERWIPLNISFSLEDAPEEAWETRCEGLGQKITGILIEFSGEMELREITLTKEKEDADS